MFCSRCKVTEMVEYPLISTRGTEFRLACPECDFTAIKALQKTNEDALRLKLAEAGVPERFLHHRLTESQTTFRDVDKVMAGKVGLFLFGDTGSGKTSMLAGWCSHMALMGLRVRFIDFSDFICDLRADFKNYNNLKTEMLGYDCLFLDNFESDNPYMYDFIFNLINAFYQHQRQVFYTAPALPAKSPLAMRIGGTTIQLEIVKRQKDGTD